ncbi:MAG: AAA family ATPase [Candidatus Dormibacteria bacterium]
MALDQLRTQASRLLDELEKAVVGKRPVLELVLLAILADGHVLIEDFPGLAKTLIARSFASCCGLTFSRIQFTPDLMPSDITGSSIYDQRLGDFQMRPGPIFANLLLADEINRSPAKTQAALLEGMQERQVTVEGVTRPLPRPFVVLATQNPIEYEGTYPLPEAQLDRFLVRLGVGYPSREQERLMLERRQLRGADEPQLDQVLQLDKLLEMQAALEEVHIDPDIQFYIVDLVEATRQHPGVQVGASPRGSLALLKLARAKAALGGRDFVTPEDVKGVAGPALAHRLSLRPELWVQRVSPDDIIRECLEQTPTPPTRQAAPLGRSAAG